MRRFVTLITLVVGAIPAASPWTSHAAPAHTSMKKYRGPSVDMRWGAVRVTVSIKNKKKITAVSASAPMERPRSAFINQQALPLLKHEVLKAQSGKVDLISGATMTSEAYRQSLQSALHKAHFKKA